MRTMSTIERDCLSSIVLAYWRWHWMAHGKSGGVWRYARALGLTVWQNVYDRGKWILR
jgi:hypothetical protein